MDKSIRAEFSISDHEASCFLISSADERWLPAGNFMGLFLPIEEGKVGPFEKWMPKCLRDMALTGNSHLYEIAQALESLWKEEQPHED